MPFDLQHIREDRLNALGQQGWLLVSTLPHLVFVRKHQQLTTSSFDLPMLLSIKQVAEQLGMSRSKVYGLLQAGQIKSIRVGRSVRVPRQELDIFLREGIS